MCGDEHKSCLTYEWFLQYRERLPAASCIWSSSNTVDSRVPPLPSRRSRRAFRARLDLCPFWTPFPVSALNINRVWPCVPGCLTLLASIFPPNRRRTLFFSHRIGQSGGGDGGNELFSSAPPARHSPSAFVPLVLDLGDFFAPPAVAATSARVPLPCLPVFVFLW